MNARARIKPKHACPVGSCTVLVDSRFLMCREHWRLVPAPLQRAVYNTWRHGGADAYLAARNAAIKAVEQTCSTGANGGNRV